MRVVAIFGRLWHTNVPENHFDQPRRPPPRSTARHSWNRTLKPGATTTCHEVPLAGHNLNHEGMYEPTLAVLTIPTSTLKVHRRGKRVCTSYSGTYRGATVYNSYNVSAPVSDVRHEF